jgi:hypothetical protein
VSVRLMQMSTYEPVSDFNEVDTRDCDRFGCTGHLYSTLRLKNRINFHSDLPEKILCITGKKCCFSQKTFC